MENKSAFTLVEMVVVLALISILSTLTFIAIAPNQRISQAADTRTKNEVAQILRAFSIRGSDFPGEFPNLNDDTEPVEMDLSTLLAETDCSGHNADQFSLALSQYYRGSYEDPRGTAYSVQRLPQNQVFVCGMLSTGERFFKYE